MRHQTHRPPRRRAGGFTLLELLIVIGIISVLVALLVPTLGRMRERARLTACVSNQRQLYAASVSFAVDHDRMLPAPSRVWDTASRAEVRDKCIWAMVQAGIADLKNGAIWPYMPSGEELRKAAILCPADNAERIHYGGGYQDKARNFSYSLHSKMLSDKDGVIYSVAISRIAKPAETVMIWEELAPNDAYTVDIQVPRRWDDQPSGRHGTNSVNLENGSVYVEKKYLVAGQGNHCFFDGHVETLTPQQVFNNPQYYTNYAVK